MNLILSIYTGHIYREVYLPVLNDQNYKLFLPSGEFGLRHDMELAMEVLDGQWSFIPGESYAVIHQKAPFEHQPLKDGQLIYIQTNDAEQIAILVWNSAATLSAFRKYRVQRERITVGKDPENDICYPEQRLISATTSLKSILFR